jgi:hypothetical protein
LLGTADEAVFGRFQDADSGALQRLAGLGVRDEELDGAGDGFFYAFDPFFYSE